MARHKASLLILGTVVPFVLGKNDNASKSVEDVNQQVCVLCVCVCVVGMKFTSCESGHLGNAIRWRTRVKGQRDPQARIFKHGDAEAVELAGRTPNHNDYFGHTIDC